MGFNEKMIQVDNLSKSFGSVKAVDDISFQVKRGELFAFLGVNGAGKSTTISMICGQNTADRGSISVNGMDTRKSSRRVKGTIGVVFQDSALDKPLTGRENLKSRAALYGITGKSFECRLQELIRTFELEEFIDRPFGKLSGGQRRRLDIARALIHKPELLILDEPTTGLDPQTRRMIWSIIQELREKDGLTVFLTTHYMEEAAAADYVVIIDHGKIVAEGTPYELKNEYVKDTLNIYGITEDEVKLLDMSYKEIRDGYQLRVETPAAVTELIQKNPDIFRDYELIKGGMDDVFLAVTGKVLGGEQS
ncbi:MAG: ABC transporter ATP-binding protein [Bacillota bacterium]|nr:ABC transporter ATP-binding protein [Bacillota bacterium]